MNLQVQQRTWMIKQLVTKSPTALLRKAMVRCAAWMIPGATGEHSYPEGCLWKTRQESAYSFMLKYSKITVWLLTSVNIKNCFPKLIIQKKLQNDLADLKNSGITMKLQFFMPSLMILLRDMKDSKGNSWSLIKVQHSTYFHLDARTKIQVLNGLLCTFSECIIVT